jgi:hypothetical protein
VLIPIALLSPTGELSIFILNQSDAEQIVGLNIINLPEKTLYLYQTTKDIVSKHGFELNAIQRFNSTKENKLILPARSITTVSSYSLKNSDNGIILQ